jgi:hypothetical protein
MKMGLNEGVVDNELKLEIEVIILIVSRDVS